MGYFKQIDTEKVALIDAIQNVEALLSSYMNGREKTLSKWDQEQFRLDDLQQELCDIKEEIESIDS